MLKITTTRAHGALTIVIAVRLTLEGSDALNCIVSEARDRSWEVKIDLTGVRLVDQPSVEYLADSGDAVSR